MAQEREAQAFVMEPGMIDGYGGGGGFEFSVQDRNGTDIRTLKAITDRFVEKLTERPEIGDVYSNYDVNYPQYKVEVDVSHCKRAGISPVTVLNELGAYLGGMLFGTLGLLLTVPGLFTIFQKIQERFKPMEKKEDFY